MSEHVISIPRDYSPTPAGRYPSDGPFNGQRFRQELLIPAMKDALRAGRIVVVDFGFADSYSSSFLEEAFGGLVRERIFSASDLRHYMRLISDDDTVATALADAQDYMAAELKKLS